MKQFVASNARDLRLFLYLQAIDFLTTAIGVRLAGPGTEISPFIRLLMVDGPLTGLALSKAGALGLAGLAAGLDKPRVIQWINCWYAALGLWNLFMILRAVGGIHL